MTKKNKKIFVNALSISRIIGACLLPIAFKMISVPLLITILAVLFITDFLDGKLSRRWEVRTTGGALLDPLGDKMLAISCMIALLYEHSFLWALLIMEVLIIILNVYRTLRGEVVKSSYIGKTKTWLLSIALILGAINLFNPEFLNDILGFLGFKTNSFTITSEIVFSSVMCAIGSEVVTFVAYLKESIEYNKNRKLEKLRFMNLKDIFRKLFDEDRYLEDKDKPLIELIKVK